MSISIIKPDGVSTTSNVVYSTSLESVFLRGAVTDEVSLTVTYEGVSYNVGIVNNAFIFPDPLNEPDGIDIVRGSNTFIFRGLDANGTVSTQTTTVVLSDASLSDAPSPPQQLSVDRSSTTVDVSFAHLDSEVSYYNLYASTVSGGGAEGYTKINYYPIDPATYGRRVESTEDLFTFELNRAAASADPLYVEVSMSQSDGTEYLASTLSDSFEVPETVSRLRTKGEIKSVSLSTRIVFKHDRSGDATSQPPTVETARFSVLSNSSPLFYVATAVKVVDGVEVESAFSSEAAGKPIDVFTTFTSLPVVGKRALTEAMVSEIYVAQPDISLQAGSVFRDVMIDPVVSELERVRFVLDFCYRASSFSALLQIDDPQGAGVSTLVSQSAYKQALGQSLFLSNDADVQAVIDQSFERLASNFGVQRRLGTEARGEVVFFTTATPTATLSVPVGTVVTGGGQSYRTTQVGSIPIDGVSSYYNPTTRRYSVTVPVICVDVGSAGNITTGQVQSGAPTGLRVTNESPMFGGEDVETNTDLASRAIASISSVDVGTKAGYERLSRNSAGVVDTFVVGAGDPYMIRDNGLGGKVDVWVRGSSVATVTDVFAPSYFNQYGAKFLPIESEGVYKFKVADLSATIFEMIDRSDLGLGLRNATTGESFDLTGYALDISKQVIMLDASIPQPIYAMTDVILGDWRSEVSDKIILRRQPVESVTSVVSAGGQEITDFTFTSDEDPLLNGRSRDARDFITIPAANRGQIVTVTDESHVLVGVYKDQLNNLGVDLISIVVKSSAGVAYLSPFVSSAPDYTIESGDNGEVYIQRTSNSAISDGETVLVTYNHVENVVVTYTTNLVVDNVQDTIEAQKNITADVVVKEVLSAGVNIKGVVVLSRGASVADVDTAVKASLTNLINSNSLGGAIYSSDVIRVIDGVEGVSYLKVPLTQLSLTEGTLILREEVSTRDLGAFTLVSELSQGGNQVWLSTSRLSHVAQDSGGAGAVVRIGDTVATLLSSSERTVPSVWESYTATVVGAEGVRVPNLQGGLTLLPNSTHRVAISLPVGLSPSDVDVFVHYRVGDSIGEVGDLVLNRFSYFSTGELSFTYEEER